MSDLLKHIQSINAQSLKWISESPEIRSCYLVHTDLDKWKECGVTDIESFERWSLATELFHILKEEGCIVSWDTLFNQSLEELEKQRNRIAA